MLYRFICNYILMTRQAINYKEDPHAYTMQLLESYNDKNMSDIGAKIGVMIVKSLSQKHTPKNHEETLQIIQQSTREELIHAIDEVGEAFAHTLNSFKEVLNDFSKTLKQVTPNK